MDSLSERLQHCATAHACRSYLAEFIGTFFYVLAAVGSAMASQKLAGGDVLVPEPSSLVAVAVANAFALFVAVFITASVSGGHVNPAVTFGRAVGGHISIPMSVIYWAMQMLGAVFACLLLKVTTVNQHIPAPGIIPPEMTGFGAAVLEGFMAFALVYTVYATADGRRGDHGVIGPLAVGLMAGANILSLGPFTGGGVMNPAYSFACAVVTGHFKNQAVYWVGPLIGAVTAAVLYDNVIFPAAPASARRDPMIPLEARI